MSAACVAVKALPKALATVKATYLTSVACVAVKASPKVLATVLATFLTNVASVEALASLKEHAIVRAMSSMSAACVADKALPKALATVKATCLTNVAFAEAQELQKVSATATATCSTRVAFAVETVTSVAPTLKLAIMTRELVATMAAAMSHSQVAKNVLMVNLSQSIRTATASMIAMRFQVVPIRLRATTMKQQTLQMVLASTPLNSMTAMVLV